MKLGDTHYSSDRRSSLFRCGWCLVLLKSPCREFAVLDVAHCGGGVAMCRLNDDIVKWSTFFCFVGGELSPRG